MSELIITERSNIVAIANAVRNRTGETNDLTLGEIEQGIYAIGGSVDLQSKIVNISTNGNQTVSPDRGYDGLSSVEINVNVPQEEPNLQDKTVTPTTSKQTITADNGYDGLDTVTVNAIPSTYIQPNGTVNIATNGMHDVTNYKSASVNVASSGGVPSTITAGDTPVLFSSTMAHTCTSTTATATGISITVPRAGTYRFKFSCARTNTSGTWTAQLRKNGTAVSDATATWSQYQGSCTADVTCNANDKIEIYSQSRGSSYRLITGQLIACINWDTGF